MSKRSISSFLRPLGVAAAIAWFGTTGVSAEPPTSPVLVELFTSQGCSSCPPADALAGVLRARDDVVVLSYHVNYWDYIGWQDPFATEETTARQHAYARAMQQRSVYTPQMVIGGKVHRVGSDHAAVDLAISEALGDEMPAPIIASRLVGSDILRVEIGSGQPQGDAEILLVTYDRDHQTDVGRGENAGRQLRNYNVVKDIIKIGSWDGAATTVDVPWSGSNNLRNDGCAVIVQAANHGPVIAAHDMLMQ